MSPILLRPIREQFEHDRVIRQLQAKWHRRFDVGINVGAEEEVSVRAGDRTCYPDLVFTSTAHGRRLHGVVEVETAESVNHLEAVSEWAHFAKARGAFYLYVPAGFTEVALRLCQSAKINVTEIWAYYAIAADVKFSLSYRSPRARAAARATKVLKTKASAMKVRKKAATKKSGKTASRTKSTVAKTKIKTTANRKRKTTAKRKK